MTDWRYTRLEKLTPPQAIAWMASFPLSTEWWITPSLLGEFAVLTYKRGKLKRARDRRHRDVTPHISKAQGLLKQVSSKSKSLLKQESNKETYKVYGRLVCHKHLFQEIDKRKNYRKFLAKAMKGRFADPLIIQYTTFIAYYTDHESVTDNRYNQLLFLSDLGFTTLIRPFRYSKGHRNLIKRERKTGSNFSEYLPVYDQEALPHKYFHRRPSLDQIHQAEKAVKKLVDVPRKGLILEPLYHHSYEGSPHRKAVVIV